MADSRAELLRKIERRLTRRLAEDMRDQPKVALWLAARRWERVEVQKQQQEQQQVRAKFKRHPLLLTFYDMLAGGPFEHAPDGVDEAIAALDEILSPEKLKFVADYLSSKRPGPPRAMLADIAFDDLVYWRRVTERLRPGVSTTTACRGAARILGERERRSKPNTLLRRYERIEKKFGSDLRRYFDTP